MNKARGPRRPIKHIIIKTTAYGRRGVTRGRGRAEEMMVKQFSKSDEKYKYAYKQKRPQVVQAETDHSHRVKRQRLLKPARKEQDTAHEGPAGRLKSGLSLEAVQAGRQQWHP